MQLIKKQTTFNQLTMIEQNTYIIPSENYYDVCPAKSIIEQREEFLKNYFTLIMKNGGSIQISKTNDIYISTIEENLYRSPNDLSYFDITITNKDYYFFNISSEEYSLMSSKQQNEYKNKIIQNILKKYIDQTVFNLAYINYSAYLQEIERIKKENIYIKISVEQTLYDQLINILPNIEKIIKSKTVIQLLKNIKIPNLTIQKYSDLRFQLFGFIRNYYPFIYMKNGYIYDLAYFDTFEIYDQLFSDISIQTFNYLQSSVNIKHKNLMVICQQNDTDYYLIPRQQLKLPLLNAPVNQTQIGNSELVESCYKKSETHHATNIEYEIEINNNEMNKKVEEELYKYIEKMIGYKTSVVGQKKVLYSKSVSKYIYDYDINIPTFSINITKEETVRFKDDIKFVVAAIFRIHPNKYTFEQYKKLPNSFISQQSFPIYLTQSIAPGSSMEWPVMKKESIENLKTIESEMQTKQYYMYEYKHINNGYIKGDFIYMSQNQTERSSGFLGITIDVLFDIPYRITADDQLNINISTRTKIFRLRTVHTLNDINDEKQIKDTIGVARYQMLNQLWQYLLTWGRNGLEVVNLPKNLKSSNTATEAILFETFFSSLVPVNFKEEEIALDTIYKSKHPNDRLLQKIFIRTPNIVNEKYEIFNNIHNIEKSEYAYNLKTLENSQSVPESYSLVTTIQQAPVNRPIDFRLGDPDWIEENINIDFNALVPTHNGMVKQGGGFIGKKQYALKNTTHLRYITSQSKDYKSGLSNSNQFKFQVNTFESYNLDKIYQNAFPTKEKQIKISLMNISSTDNINEQKTLYLNNQFITNIVIDYDYLSQLKSASININIFSKE